MKKFVKLFLAINIAFGSFAISAKEENKMNILQNQPVFELKLEGFGAIFMVEVNGARVFQQWNAAGKIETRLPINHFMNPADNTFKIFAWSGDDSPINPHAFVKIELVVSDHTQPQNEFTISNLIFDNIGLENRIETSVTAGKLNSLKGFTTDDAGDLTINGAITGQFDNVHTHSRVMNIPSSLPLWAFFSSDDLPDYESMSDDEYYQHMDVLLIEYMKVQDAIKNNDIASILPMFEERNKELDAAFYHPPGTLAEKIKVALNDAANDESAALVELKTDYVDFEYSEGNKLNKLSRNGNKAAITLNYKEIEGSYRFDMIFRVQDGKWILTR